MNKGSTGIEVYRIKSGKSVACRQILESLPEWFGIPKAIEQYVADVGPLFCFAASVDSQAIGFLSLKQHFSQAWEIHVMGVTKPWQRKGIGRQLLAEAERVIAKAGAKLLTVKTLSSKRESPEYAATRAFYQKQGFIEVEELPRLWGEGNPCLFMAKVL